MDVVEIKKETAWDDIVSQYNGHLLQSWQWGEFQSSCERKVWRLALSDPDASAAAIQVIKYSLPLGKSYLYCPRGPIKGNDQFPNLPAGRQVPNFQLLFEKIIEIARQEKSIFVRVDPEVTKESQLSDNLQETDFIQGTQQIQPRDTLFLDLSSNEEDLLAQMHSKARYNIRLAGRKGVEVKQSNDRQDVNEFYNLMKATTQRDEFSAHPKEYYQRQVQILGKKDMIKLFSAEHGGKIIAAAIVSFFGDRATYLHGASSYEHRRFMAPHLVQWEAIKEAHRRGLKYYDFGGIAPSGSSDDHPWSGITRFKQGFGGKEKNWIGAMELAINPLWYKVYNLTKKLRS